MQERALSSTFSHGEYRSAAARAPPNALELWLELGKGLWLELGMGLWLELGMELGLLRAQGYLVKGGCKDSLLACALCPLWAATGKDSATCSLP